MGRKWRDNVTEGERRSSRGFDVDAMVERMVQRAREAAEREARRSDSDRRCVCGQYACTPEARVVHRGRRL